MSSSVFNMQGRQCPRCGMSWPMTEARCKNCGYLFETAGGGSAVGGNVNPGSSMPGAGQFPGAGWGQSPVQAPQQNTNNAGNMGSGMQWNQSQSGSSSLLNQPQPGSGTQWNQPQSGSGMQWNQTQAPDRGASGSGMQWGTQSPTGGSGMQWNQSPSGNNVGSGTQWNQSPSQSSMGSGMQWNQPQSSSNVGSGTQWNTQSPNEGPGSPWNTNTGGATGSGMQWGQASSSPANSTFAGSQNNSSFSSPFAGGGSSETPFSTFNRASTENSSTFDTPNVSNSIPFTPALDPFASSAQKKRPRWGMIIGAILLLIVIIGASVGGVVYFSRGDNTTTQGNTPTTNTLKPLPTPASKPLFSDTFVNNNNGWRLEKDEKGAFAVSLGKNALTLADNNNKILWEMLPNTKRYGDFQLFVNATLTKGDPNNGGGGYGVYVRSASTQSGDLATYYRFELYGDGSYSIFKGQSDPANGKVLTPKEIVANTQYPAIQTMGKQNQLVIKAKGPNIVFIVNGQTIKSISDSSYLSGSIALFVSNLPNTKPGAEVQYSNLGIYPAE